MSSFLPQTHPALSRMRLDIVFMYYDGPVLFTARTAWNQPYLAVAADEVDGAVHYLYVPISEERLSAVRTGVVELREAFRAPEAGVAFLVMEQLSADEPVVRELALDDIRREWLPDAGERLDERLETITSFSADSLVAAAQREGRHLIGLEVEQASTLRRTELPLRVGGPLLTEFQELADAMSTQSDFALVQVQAASFVFVLTPLLGNGMVAPQPPSIPQIQELVEAVGTDSFATALTSLTPRRKTRMRDFLTALSDADTGATLVSASPEGNVVTAVVSLDQVRDGLRLLRAKSEPDIHTHDVVGFLIGLNHARRTFSVREESATGGRKKPRSFSGKFDAGVEIEGVASGATVRYHFDILQENAAAEFDDSAVTRTFRIVSMRLADAPGAPGVA